MPRGAAEVGRARVAAYSWRMDLPPPDPKKLLAHWMEWEKGEATPGRVMANLKTAGMRELLERLAADAG